jgi:hypothetical protein
VDCCDPNRQFGQGKQQILITLEGLWSLFRSKQAIKISTSGIIEYQIVFFAVCVCSFDFQNIWMLEWAKNRKVV